MCQDWFLLIETLLKGIIFNIYNILSYRWKPPNKLSTDTSIPKNLQRISNCFQEKIENFLINEKKIFSNLSRHKESSVSCGLFLSSLCKLPAVNFICFNSVVSNKHKLQIFRAKRFCLSFLTLMHGCLLVKLLYLFYNKSNFIDWFLVRNVVLKLPKFKNFWY